jgi:riboflavin biosynthesis pyrimidine reductase
VFDKLSEKIGISGRQFNVFVSNSGGGFTFTRGVFVNPIVQTVIATTKRGLNRAAADLKSSGVSSDVLLWDLDDGSGRVDLVALLDRLKENGATRILTEAGGRLYGSLEAQGLVDELFLTRLPSVVGESESGPRRSFSSGVYTSKTSPQLSLESVRLVPDDSVLFERRKYR